MADAQVRLLALAAAVALAARGSGYLPARAAAFAHLLSWAVVVGEFELHCPLTPLTTSTLACLSHERPLNGDIGTTMFGLQSTIPVEGFVDRCAGTNLWTTFFAGITMFKNLPRQVFGKLQVRGSWCASTANFSFAAAVQQVWCLRHVYHSKDAECFCGKHFCRTI